MPEVNIQKTVNSRVWLIPGGASPNNDPAYMQLGRATSLSQGLGDLTPVRVPSRNSYETFDTIDIIQGQEDLPGLGVEYRMQMGRSEALKIAKQRCPQDVQLHVGKCADPSDFDRGYEKVIVLEDGRATNYGTSDLGAFDADANEPVMETVDYMGRILYEILPVTAGKVADTLITDEMISVKFADRVACGDCGAPSDGTQVAVALVADNSGSPGLPPKVLVTADGGATWRASSISTAALTETVLDIMSQGPYIVVLAGGTNDRLHYVLLSELLAGTESWSVVTTGVVATGSPRRFVEYDVAKTFVLGDAGYIYKMGDAPRGLTVLSDGGVTTSNLLAGHTLDGDTVVAVGASNTIVISKNGGKSWSLLTGPSAQAGISATAVLVRGSNSYIVGYADGDIYYTINGGTTWTQVAIDPVSAIKDLAMSSSSVLWAAVTGTDSKGDILRSINGGRTFPSISQANGGSLFPACDTINRIAATPAEVNVVLGAGLADDASDGILVKVA